MSLATIFQRQTEPQKVGLFCERVLLPDGPYRGEIYDYRSEAPQTVAVQAMDGEILDAEGLPFRDITLAWCTQAGKSLSSVLVPALHSVVEKKESVVYCLPSLDLLNKVWVDKLKPSIEGAGYGAWLPEKGPGSKGGRPSSLQFRDPENGQRAGSIIFIAGGSGSKKEAGQAGVTASTVLLDEADEYEDAHRIALVRQRAAAFGSDAMTIAASTVKKDHGSVILSLVEDGTASRIWYACPHCGKFQPLTRSGLKYEGEDDLTVAESASYACSHCGSMWNEKDRKKALCEWRLVHKGQSVDDHGNVVGPIPRTKSFGLLCPKLDFSIGLGLPELAVEEAKAKRHLTINGDHGLMRSYVRDRWSEPYQDEESGVRIDTQSLAGVSERSDIFKRTVPSWAEFTTMSIDVQHNRCYWLLMAHGENGRWAIIDYGYEYYTGSHDGPEATEADRHRTWDAIAEKAAEGWPVAASDEMMSPVLCGIDSGYLESQVLSWCKLTGWHPLKGVGGEQIKRMGRKVESAGKIVQELRGWVQIRKIDKGAKLWHVDADNARRSVHHGLTLIGDAAGRGMLPQGERANGMLCLHLSAEVFTQDDATGKWYWRKVRGRNDLLDCSTYALSLGRFWHHYNTKRKNKQARSAYGNIGSTL